MKKVGIVCDNYKIDKFKEELTKAGFAKFEIVPFINQTSSISIYVEPWKVNDVMKICRHVEIHFKQSN